MTARFVSNILVLALGGAFAALTLALAPAVVGWIALGVGCAAVLISAAAFPARGRGAAQRWLDLPVAVVGGWTIVASRLYAGSTLRWLSFSEAVALCALGLTGLLAHEIMMESAARRAASAAAVNGRRPEVEMSLSERSRAGAW